MKTSRASGKHENGNIPAPASFGELEAFLGSLSSAGIRPGLDRIGALLHRLGNPENRFPSVHIVGTNGKGSTAAFTERILRESGYRTALYTSPHLESPSERLLLDGVPLPLGKWYSASLTVAGAMKEDPLLRNDPPSFFETVTAVAFLLCAEEGVDIAVVEAGLGGRLDATNLLGRVVLTLVASISMDHTEFLGNTLESIAGEKFAVMRKGTPAFFSGSPTSLVPLFLRRASEIGAEAHVSASECSVSGLQLSEDGISYLFRSKDTAIPIQTSLPGIYQAENSSLAAAGALRLSESFPGITPETIRCGILRAKWPGRFEVLRKEPPMVLDGGHNPDGIRRLAETLSLMWKGKRTGIVYAAMKDKDYRQCLSLLKAPGRRLFCTCVPGMLRSASPEEIAEAALSVGWSREETRSFSDPLEAAAAAERETEAVIFCGSLYFIGFLRGPLTAVLSREKTSP